MNDDNILLEEGTQPNNETNIVTTIDEISPEQPTQQDEMVATENIDSESSYIDRDETTENVESETETETSSDNDPLGDENATEKSSTEQELFPKIPYHERYYLRYGEGKRTGRRGVRSIV